MPDEKVAAAIRTLLNLDVGAYVGIFGMLEIGQLENGNFWVRSREIHPERKDLWMKENIPLEEAIEHFVRIRKEREIGFDIEADLLRQRKAATRQPSVQPPISRGK